MVVLYLEDISTKVFFVCLGYERQYLSGDTGIPSVIA